MIDARQGGADIRAVIETDVLVLAGNPGGTAAAISAARAGLQVVILESSKTLGGINANGVFGFDSARPGALSGIATEISDRVRRHYRDAGIDDPVFHRRADTVWESHVLAKVWQDLADETENLTCLVGAVAVGASVEDGRITEIFWRPATDVFGNVDMEAGPEYRIRPRFVVDASYEGDILEWAGVPYRIGREPRSWGEPHAGKIYTSDMAYSPDGWLPHSVLPGSSGDGGEAIMAFACRLHCRWYDDLSPDAAHRIKQPPPGYDPANYAWTPMAVSATGDPVWFAILNVLVNDKFYLNRMVRGSELSGPARDLILAHPKDRKALRQRFIDHALGHLYFIQTEGGSPGLGLAHDEFTDNGNIPYQLYIREGRRIVAEAEITEAEVNPYILGDGYRPPLRPDSIAVGDWLFESHACTDQMDAGYLFPEGWIFNRITQAPYQIPYGCLLPKQIDNLLVPGSLGATHIGFSATRCEAARIQTGIAAAAAAVLALQNGCRPHDLAVGEIQDRIVAAGGQLIYFDDVDATHPDFSEIQWAGLRGFVPQSDDWKFGPETTVTWAEIVRETVRCLNLPISVTGMHFENVGPRHPSFRYLESIYDLGSRADIDIFQAKSLNNEDPMRAILRLYPQNRLIPIALEDCPSRAKAAVWFARVAEALGRDTGLVRRGHDGLLNRADLAAVLRNISR